MTLPLLSVVIPTFNRASYLALTLRELKAGLLSSPNTNIEIVVCDNASSDTTPDVVRGAIAAGLPIRSVRNAENIGSDANIAQSFNLAIGRYVLILSDDDILLPDVLGSLISHLESGQFGVVCLRAYGYDRDFIAEHPGGGGQDKIFEDAGKFLAGIGHHITLISACVIDKDLLQNIDARTFCGGNLVQVHLVINAVLRSKKYLYQTQYSIACKRNNSGGYDFSKVFVEELGNIFDLYMPLGLSLASTRKFESRMMLGYYPYYLLRQRLNRSDDLDKTYKRFFNRHKRRLLFWIMIFPILKLPRSLAIVWGGVAATIGRVVIGDFRRGLTYSLSRLLRAETKEH